MLNQRYVFRSCTLARPLTRPGLNSTTQREICWWLAQGDSKEVAAKKAGLPDTYRLHRFARTREFADELRSAMLDHMSTNLAPKAVRILDEIMSDSKVQPRVRVDAAKCLLDRAGYSTSEERKKPPDPEEMESWSTVELQKFIRAGEDQLRKESDRRFKDAKLIESPSVAEVLS